MCIRDRSYTTFEAQSEAKQADDTIIVNVRVTNTGNLRGKRIVQVYLGLPCGKLGNPVKVLAGFAKTRTLEPGESQTVTIEIDLREFASYDDSGISGYKSCFVLEQGDYHIEVGSNVRDTKDVLTVRKETPEIVRQAREAAAVKPGCGFNRLVNRNGKLYYEAVPTVQKDLKATILSELPQERSAASRDIPFSEVISGNASVDSFVAQLSPEELDQLTHGHGKMNFCYGISGKDVYKRQWKACGCCESTTKS